MEIKERVIIENDIKYNKNKEFIAAYLDIQSVYFKIAYRIIRERGTDNYKCYIKLKHRKLDKNFRVKLLKKTTDFTEAMELPTRILNYKDLFIKAVKDMYPELNKDQFAAKNDIFIG